MDGYNPDAAGVQVGENVSISYFNGRGEAAVDGEVVSAGGGRIVLSRDGGLRFHELTAVAGRDTHVVRSARSRGRLNNIHATELGEFTGIKVVE